MLQVTENLGMVMVFTVVTSALEWLAGHMEGLARAALEQQQQQQKEQEEAERVSCFHSFLLISNP